MYIDCVNELVTEHKAKINSWLQQPPCQLGQESLSQVLPEDSVSTAKSGKTLHSRARSATSLMKSLSSARARAAEKKAALQRLHELQDEELKIQQMKSQVELRAEIAAAEAKKRSYEADASQYGYGAVTYLKVQDNKRNSKCSFVIGNSRLAPIKPPTIPRMELSAAVVATKFEKITRQELSLPIDQSFFWTDSTCVLC